MLRTTLLFLGCLVSLSNGDHNIMMSSNSEWGRQLLMERSLNDGNNNYDFIADYSIKFQGCHHVQQWNENVDEDNDVRILTKRLVRFRLCEQDNCVDSSSNAGCTSKYGDYVVDMDVFLESWFGAIQEQQEDLCAEIECDCNTDDCYQECYEANDASFCLQDNEQFNVEEYLACNQFNMGRRQLEDGNDDQYYIGPFCAEQGGEIHLGMFTDDTCTTFASNGYTLFSNAMGYSMPYSDQSLVSYRCLGCGELNENGYYESSGSCEDMYTSSGKCETRMNVDYPNESSCNYIEGIKIIREDGVIRTSQNKKSKAAAVAIGLFCTLSVLLAGYVYYLRTKLARAQINLAASAQSLT